MAKIAVELGQPYSSNGRPAGRVLAAGEGWSVSEMLCVAGPRDRTFEEQHARACLAIVTQGTFQYRSSAGRELMTPGSVLLGNPGQYFECGHEHAAGDHCISFAYEPEYFAGLAHDAGIKRASFARLRIPPTREMSGVLARACALHANHGGSRVAEWEDIGREVAARALELTSGREQRATSLPAAEARVTRVLRMMEKHPDRQHDLASLAVEAKLSRYHFLRVFQQLTGLTPHQYILRARLRRAATRLMIEREQVIKIALDCGFGDVSNFNHAFRAEFGVSPREYRKSTEYRLKALCTPVYLRG